jgi:hypothetical protein
MGHASYRSLSKVSAIFCFTTSLMFVCITIAFLGNYPAQALFALLAGACACSGFYFLEQQEVRGYAKRAGMKQGKN